MADKLQCEVALRSLATHLEEHVRTSGPSTIPERTLVCRITDLRTSFSGKLRDGYLVDIAEEEQPNAQIIFTAKSDDLIAVIEGSLSFMSAWTSGRLKINASMRD